MGVEGDHRGPDTLWIGAGPAPTHAWYAGSHVKSTGVTTPTVSEARLGSNSFWKAMRSAACGRTQVP